MKNKHTLVPILYLNNYAMEWKLYYYLQHIYIVKLNDNNIIMLQRKTNHDTGVAKLSIYIAVSPLYCMICKSKIFFKTKL